METPNTAALSARLRADGLDEEGIDRVFRTFNVAEFDKVRADG
jgi:hypothetical protein